MKAAGHPRGEPQATSPRPGRGAAAAVPARDVALSLVALGTLGVAQPLLDLLGRNATFLVAHDIAGSDVVVLAVGMTMMAPLLAAAVVLLLRRLWPAVGAVVHLMMLAALAAVLMLVVLRLSGAGEALGAPASLALAAAAGTGVVAAYRRSPGLRRALAWAAVAAPLVAASFLLATPARALVFPPPAPAEAADVDADAPPIVFVVFDELPLASLLDGSGAIDAGAFPGFARLADDATLLRNTTTVAGQTSDAVPALLTGRYPEPGTLPIAADHPSNLFSLLSGSYELAVTEPLTELCTTAACVGGRRTAPAARYGAFLADLAVVGAHLAVPAQMAGDLPSLDAGWRDFRRDAEAAGKEMAVRDRFRAAREDSPADVFNGFVDRISPADRPVLHFLHVLAPHSPWVYLPDGRSYAAVQPPAAPERGRWSDDEWLTAQGYQRHLLQVQLADRLLDRLLDRLEAEGLYDQALLVVVADHGASLAPGTSLRVLERRTWGEIGAVPLLVKQPGQRDGQVSDRPVETVDVLPTILEVLGADAPAGLDGMSVLDPDAPQRREKRYFGGEGTLSFDAAGEEKWSVVERKLSLFGTGEGGVDPFLLAPAGTRSLLGRRPPADAGAAGAPTAVLDRPHAFADVDTSASELPVLVAGTLQAPGRRPVIAVAVNGTIVAVTRADPPSAGSARGFRAIVPPEILRDGRNTVALLLVGPRGALTAVELR